MNVATHKSNNLNGQLIKERVFHLIKNQENSNQVSISYESELQASGILQHPVLQGALVPLVAMMLDRGTRAQWQLRRGHHSQLRSLPTARRRPQANSIASSSLRLKM